jgi:hypothetical protein
MMESWKGIDTYLQQVDRLFCSYKCPCYIKYNDVFLTNPRTAFISTKWVRVYNGTGPINFQSCPVSVQDEALISAKYLNQDFDTYDNFNQLDFFQYMNKLELSKNCSGWCNITYYNNATFTNTLMTKYLFSDVNR